MKEQFTITRPWHHKVCCGACYAAHNDVIFKTSIDDAQVKIEVKINGDPLFALALISEYETTKKAIEQCCANLLVIRNQLRGMFNNPSLNFERW